MDNMVSGAHPVKQVPHRIYADHAATTPVTDSVRAAMEPYLAECFGNASAVHREGREASRAVFAARKRCADILGCLPDELIFTSGGTESDNLAIKGNAFAHGLRGHILTTAIEHHAVLNSARFCSSLGMTSDTVLPEADGIVSPDAFAAAIREDTVLCGCMLANNEIGTIQPIKEIADAVHRKGIPMFCDAVQGMGQIPVSVSVLGADLLSLSGHKIGAPKGVGLLYIRRGTPITPLLDGGGQEMGLRAGTENVAGIVGMAQALADAAAHTAETTAHLSVLSDALMSELITIPHCVINGTTERIKRLPGNVNVSFPGLDAESMVLHLDRMGIAASAGSACTAGKTEPSHVLKALGHDDRRATASLRFTLGYENTMDDVRAIGAAVRQITEQLYTMTGM